VHGFGAPLPLLTAAFGSKSFYLADSLLVCPMAQEMLKDRRSSFVIPS
jgi:hypothetical protein